MTLFLDPASYSLRSLHEEMQLPDERKEDASSLNSEEQEPLEFWRLMRMGLGGFRYILYYLSAAYFLVDL